MGDLARSLGQQQTALIHYQGAFRADRGRTSATRKAITVYFELGREEQAKQILDVLVDQLGTIDAASQKELAEQYLKAAEALLVRPQAHKVVADALDKAQHLAADLPRGKTLRAELEAVLLEGETLSEFVEASVRSAVAFRRVQTRFHERGQAAWEHHLATGESVSADEVLDRLQAKLDAKRKQLGG